MQPSEFRAKWSRSRLKERSAAQEHFTDLCRMLGQPTPGEADPDGEFYTFERGAAKTGGGDGWADVWKRGHFAWEYKGKHANLEAAYRQVLEYREALENPPLLVVCDLDRFEIHTNFTNTAKKIYRFNLSQIAEPETIRILNALFTNPDALRPGRETSPVTEETAKKFGVLADMLRKRGVDPQQAAHFLTRVVFCLFAEDAGLLPLKHFSNIVDKTLYYPLVFDRQIRELFDAMAHGGFSVMEPIARFNGGLFADESVIETTEEERRIIRDVSDYDWSAIEPAIFGTLFERSLDPAKRSQIGAHYTHPDDILDVLEPVLMAPLRRQWEQVREQALALSEMATAPAASAARRRSDQRAAIQRLIQEFLDRLSQVTVLDPACGSGNFLYLSLNLLLDLEREVIQFGGDLGLPLALSAVSPAQLHGIEINPYARELAQAAIWIGYLQWRRKYSFAVPRNPILDPLDTIENRDAILDLSDPANPREPEWPAAEFIVGNPPFLGAKLVRTYLDDSYVDALHNLYAQRVPADADLVCYWFERARTMLTEHRTRRVGLLATQAIRGGVNRHVLEQIKKYGNIFIASADRPWILEGASVRVSIVGFDDGSERVSMLDGRPVRAINANLTEGSDLTSARRLKENQGIAFQGPGKVGDFDISDEIATNMLRQQNPHGKSNREVIRPWINGADITGRTRNMWIIDFGEDMSVEDAALYEAPFEYLKQYVYEYRLSNRDRQRRENWWLLGRSGGRLRAALAPLTRYMATSMVAKHRFFIWLDSAVLPANVVIAIAIEDDFSFGVLHSRPHQVWAARTGTQLESRPRYTPTTTFETFPFPRPTPELSEAIAAAARELNTLRDNWLNPPEASEAELKQRTLTNLYNKRPTWLANVHAKLDRAVLDAYGWPHTIPDDDLLARLLALNLEREPA